MTRRPILAALVCAAISLSAAASPAIATSAGCQTVSYEGRTFIMYKHGVKCTSARRWVKRLHKTKRGPKGWTCSSGSNYRTGGYCSRGSRYFGWHPAD